MSAEISAGRAGRQRVSGTVESLPHRGCSVRYVVELVGELSVEQTVGVDEPFDGGQAKELSRGHDDPLVIDSSGNTVGC